MSKILNIMIVPVTQLFMLFLGTYWGIEMAEHKLLQKQAEDCAACTITYSECISEYK